MALDMNLNIDLNDLDLNNIGSWPAPVRIVLLAMIFILVLFLGYQLSISGKLDELSALETKETALQKDFEEKQQKAVNLDAYKKQMQEMKESFGELLRQLPAETEVPGLVEDISHQGLAAGLVFKSIRLQPEKQIEFYVELPIEITVEGNYLQFANFVSSIAVLPRIVTMHDFKITTVSDKSQDEHLEMKILVKTYRYSDEADKAEKANKNNQNNVMPQPKGGKP